MKAIYLNLDPYLQAVADWLNAGKPGTVPSFDPLPVAVTIPLGESACVYCLAVSAYDPTGPVQSWDDLDNQTVSIDGQSLIVGTEPADTDGMDIIDGLVVNGLSNLAPSAKYLAATVSGNSLSVKVCVFTDDDSIMFTIPVLVRHETASGPVDLVDFTPPASAIAAGTDLKGATFDGNKIVAAAGTGALSAPAGA